LSTKLADWFISEIFHHHAADQKFLEAYWAMDWKVAKIIWSLRCLHYSSALLELPPVLFGHFLNFSNTR
jgi:hypothetical protein